MERGGEELHPPARGRELLELVDRHGPDVRVAIATCAAPGVGIAGVFMHAPFAVLKGAVDAGLKVSHNPEALPDIKMITRNEKLKSTFEKVKGAL